LPFFEPCQNYLLKIRNAGEKRAIMQKKAAHSVGRRFLGATLISGLDTIFRLDRREKVPAM
jgi:hypothetical protein